MRMRIFAMQVNASGAGDAVRVDWVLLNKNPTRAYVLLLFFFFLYLLGNYSDIDLRGAFWLLAASWFSLILIDHVFYRFSSHPFSFLYYGKDSGHACLGCKHDGEDILTVTRKKTLWFFPFWRINEKLHFYLSDITGFSSEFSKNYFHSDPEKAHYIAAYHIIMITYFDRSSQIERKTRLINTIENKAEADALAVSLNNAFVGGRRGR